MKRFLSILIVLLPCLLFASCHLKAEPIKGDPIVRYRARPGSIFSYRYLRLLENTGNGLQEYRKQDNYKEEVASIKTSSSSVKSIKLIDYPKFMDNSGFITTIKKIPSKIAILDPCLAQIWKLSGGRIDLTVQATVTRGIIADQKVTLVDQDSTKSIDYELLLANNPDLIILNSNNQEHIKVADILRMYDIPVLAYNVDNFLDYLSILSVFTKILETPENYEEYGSKLFDQVESKLDITKKESKRVLIIPRENQDHCAVLIRNILLELGAKPTIMDSISDTNDEDVDQSLKTDFTIDLRWKEYSKLRNDLINFRWDLAYTYLSEFLYGEDYE